jgi:threonine dehydrogenase-like Zn-dependent dehydrogenase
MRAAVYRERGVVRIEERSVPVPGSEEVVVEVSHCGICGTDVHLALEGWGRRGSVLGHEWSGRIARVGADVSGWTAGDRVVGVPQRSCGACRWCRAERPSLCEARPGAGVGETPDGAFAPYVRAHASQLVRVPGGLPLRAAALAEPLAVALHALNRAGVRPGMRALVTGAGPLGLLVIAALRAHGVDDVIASEPAPARRERAGQVGATACVAPEALAAPRLPFQLAEAPVDVALECSGSPAAMESALAQLGRGGTLVLVGTGLRRPSFDHNRILLNELVVTGAFNYDAGGFAAALELLTLGSLPVDLLTEPDDIGLDAIPQALERLARGEIAGKVLVAPGGRT